MDKIELTQLTDETLSEETLEQVDGGAPSGQISGGFNVLLQGFGQLITGGLAGIFQW